MPGNILAPQGKVMKICCMLWRFQSSRRDWNILIFSCVFSLLFIGDKEKTPKSKGKWLIHSYIYVGTICGYDIVREETRKPRVEGGKNQGTTVGFSSWLSANL